ISMMEKLSEYKSPIYGRRTGQLKLNPFNYLDSSKFVEIYSPEDKAIVYGILGGMPAYLLAFDQNLTIWENLREKYLSTTSILYMDPMFVLRDELDEPRRYFAIMESISQGKNTLSEIGALMGIDRNIATKYLGVLIELGLIKRLLPFGMKRNGRYFIDDNYFDFWFKFIYPNMDLIEAGRTEEVLEIIKKELNNHMGHVFKKIVREYMGKKLRGVAPLWFHEIEIDLMGEDESGKLFAGEVKWSTLTNKDAQRELEKLRQKIIQLKIDKDVEYGLFVKKIKVESTLPITEINDIYSNPER
ncbi:MAG: ATP-binding protein, partial [Thermoplasmataceae archaeon]